MMLVGNWETKTQPNTEMKVHLHIFIAVRVEIFILTLRSGILISPIDNRNNIRDT